MPTWPTRTTSGGCRILSTTPWRATRRPTNRRRARFCRQRAEQPAERNQNLKIVNVRRKPLGLAADLKADKSLLDNAESTKSLQDQGFFPMESGEVFASGGELPSVPRTESATCCASVIPRSAARRWQPIRGTTRKAIRVSAATCWPWPNWMSPTSSARIEGGARDYRRDAGHRGCRAGDPPTPASNRITHRASTAELPADQPG